MPAESGIICQDKATHSTNAADITRGDDPGEIERKESKETPQRNARRAVYAVMA